MLNNRLEDLIYKYKSYRIKKIIKSIIGIFLFIFISSAFYSLYKKTLDYKEKKHKTNNIIEHKTKYTNKKPKIIKVSKKVHLNEEKILNKNSLKILLILERKKPSYQTAIDLANYYYKNKDYNLSSKWAKIATNRSPNKENGWLIYAKSKIKLNQKGMAKKALKIYLLKYHSREISNLLNSL